MEIKLNLATRPYLNRQSVRLWLLLACVFAGVLLIFNGLYSYQNYRQLNLLQSRFQELDAQVAAVQGAPEGYSPERYAALKGEVAQVNEIVAEEAFRWTTLLDRFEKELPAAVSISTIQPDFKGRSVQLSCIARDTTAMTQFIDNLLLSDDFNQAFLLRHADVEVEQNGRTQLLVDFSLVIREAF